MNKDRNINSIVDFNKVGKPDKYYLCFIEKETPDDWSVDILFEGTEGQVNSLISKYGRNWEYDSDGVNYDCRLSCEKGETLLDGSLNGYTPGGVEGLYIGINDHPDLVYNESEVGDRIAKLNKLGYRKANSRTINMKIIDKSGSTVRVLHSKRLINSVTPKFKEFPQGLDHPIFEESKFFNKDYDAGHVPSHVGVPKRSVLNKMAEKHFLDEIRNVKGDVIVNLVDYMHGVYRPEKEILDPLITFDKVSKESLQKVAPYVGVDGHTFSLHEDSDDNTCVLWGCSLLKEMEGNLYINIYPALGPNDTYNSFTEYRSNFFKIFDILAADKSKPSISSHRFTKSSLGKYLNKIDNYSKD